MNEQVVALLEAGLALIPTPDRWTQKVSALNSFGFPVSTFADCVACRCSFGALNKASGGYTANGDRVRYLAEACLNKAFGRSFVAANDDPETTHEMVVAGWKRAIQFAKAATP